VFCALKRYEEALADANKCIELQPHFAKIYCKKAWSLFYLGQIDEAKICYDKAFQIQADLQNLLQEDYEKFLFETEKAQQKAEREKAEREKAEYEKAVREKEEQEKELEKSKTRKKSREKK